MDERGGKLRKFRSLGSKVISFSIFILIIFLILFSIFFFTMRNTDNTILIKFNNFGNLIINQSTNALTARGEKVIEEKSVILAKQLSNYILIYQNMSILDLQKDSHFKAMAVQSVGKTGYTAVHDSNAINYFHVNPKIVGLDLHTLADEFPDFWKILEQSLTENASGYYKWKDADGKIRDKYMYCTLVGQKNLTVCATTYIDEFLSPVVLLQKTLENSSIEANIFMRDSLNMSFLIFVLIFVVFLSVFSFIFLYVNRKIIRPVKDLHQATEKLEKGNFKTRINIRTGDEFEILGDSFNKTVEALEKLDDERKQLDKSKTEFLSITSHELRSPMTPMKAQLQMLLKEYFGKLNQKQKDSLNIVLRNTKHLDKIIVDFLDVSRIEAARLKFNFVKVNLKSYIKDIIKEMTGFMPEKNIKIEADIDNLPVIETDPDRIMQVLRNLINNAKKFSPKNSKIFIDVKAKKKYIFFSIRDQGIGLSQKNQIRIFEPFFQAEQTIYRKHSGTGLGLAIARGIVESQGGKIWIKSEPGAGSIFYFTIPLKPIKKIKPIKLLFSEKASIEFKVRDIFKKFFGSLGKSEFEDFLKKNELTKENLFRYIDSLVRQGIVEKQLGEIFKNNINIIFGERTEK